MFSIFNDVMFTTGLIVGFVFALVIVILAILGMAAASTWDDGEIPKTRRALRAHRKERRRADKQAVSMAHMMVCDGTLQPPKR